MRKILVLTKTEFILAFREFSGVLFGIIIPVALITLLGVLYGDKPAYEGADFTFIQQSVPAVISIGIIATGLMSIPLTISDYRSKKILKRFQVTPTSPLSLLLAQGITNFIYTIISGILVWIVAKVFFGYQMNGSVGLFLLVYSIVLISMYSLGFFVASIARTINSANLLACAIYFPMLFVSGATIPYEIMPKGLQIFADIMPLTHGIKLLKSSSLDIALENGIISVMYLVLIAILCTTISIKTFRWE